VALKNWYGHGNETTRTVQSGNGEAGSCTVNECSNRIDMGLDYDSTVMLTCKLLFAAVKAIVDVGPH